MGDRVCDAVVIGAGIAGSTLAKQLADSGWDTMLLDRQTFPRHKVCGEFLSPEAMEMLDMLGMKERVLAEQPALLESAKLYMPHGGCIETALPGAALGISRWTLDPLLHEEARRAGAEVLTGTAVSRVHPCSAGYAIEAKRGGERLTFLARTVIAAWGAGARSGIWSGGDTPPRRGSEGRESSRRQPEGASYVGVKSHYSGVEPGAAVELYFVEGGYVGIAAGESGHVNVAALLTRAFVQQAKSGGSGGAADRGGLAAGHGGTTGSGGMAGAGRGEAAGHGGTTGSGGTAGAGRGEAAGHDGTTGSGGTAGAGRGEAAGHDGTTGSGGMAGAGRGEAAGYGGMTGSGGTTGAGRGEATGHGGTTGSGEAVLTILEAAIHSHPKLAERLRGASSVPGTQAAVAPVRLVAKPREWEGLPHIGDASVMIAPLCGDGMSMALRSSLLCAPLADRYLRGTLSYAGWREAYQSAVQQQFRRPLRWGQAMQFLFAVPGLGRLLPAAARLSPTLVSALVKATRLKL
ncbi:hypothetical protein EBB07_34315 [Paenibacillaceae bacterium]|nr:hypothetical protein EBB07_34315 [Paenibacillaceae bacterium]